MIVIMAATFAVKAAAVVKDIVIAGHFGLGDELDAFLIALAIPAFATSVMGQSFSAAFMPEYVRLREHDSAASAKRLLSGMMVLNVAILVLCCLVLAAIGKPVIALIASEFSPAKRALAYQLYLLLLPLVVLEGVIMLWGAVLHAGEKFALAALAPILTPLTVIVVLLVIDPQIGITALAWGTVGGCGAELLLLGFVLSRRGLLPLPARPRLSLSTRTVVRQSLPLILGGMTMSASPMIDQIMASWLGTGSVAALNYGGKIPSFLAGIGVTAMGTALLPHFSRLVALSDYAAIRHTLRIYMRWIIVISVPLTLAFIGASEWIVRIVFERGAFTPDDTLLVSSIQQLFFLQVPFFVLGILGVRLLVAMSKNHLVTIMAVINLLVNVAGNFVFMRWLGVKGIALSTSVVYMVSMAMILWLVHRHLALLERGGRAPQ